MGMVGNYVAVDEVQLKQVMDGELDLLNLESEGFAVCDVDKAWQGIHDLLCGCADQPPMRYVVPMMNENMLVCNEGLFSFYITKEQVKEAAAYLASLDDDRIRELYDSDSMQGDKDEEFYEYLHYQLMKLKAFLKESAEQEKSVIFYIC